MRLFRSSRSQYGQAFVEFALVLPIFLIIVLGVIAFGHLFYVYASVVSASREAARWGMATGISTNGGPHYKDCQAIKDAAVRVGQFAGVKPESVSISYDHGPDDAAANPGCPYDAQLYDRVKVSVTVNYRPIVPFIDLPTFPITANSSRTIIMGQQVGVVPTSGAAIPTTSLQIIPNPDAGATSSKHKETQAFIIQLTASDGSAPTGTLTFKDATTNDNSSCGASFNPASGGKTCSFTFNKLGAHNLVATYTPSGNYIGVSPLSRVWVVASKLTKTKLKANPAGQQKAGRGVDVTVHVEAKSPDTGTPDGNVVLTYGDDELGSKSLNASGDAVFAGLTFSKLGSNNMLAVYQGNDTYGSSQDGTSYLILNLTGLNLSLSANPASANTGDSVTFTLTASSTNGGSVPSGSVTLSDNASHTCTANLGSDGKMSCSWSYAKGGQYSLTASYAGDANYPADSTSLTYSVNQPQQIYPTTTSISVSPSTGFANQPATITVQVASAGGVPVGVVNITGDGGLTCPNPILLNSSGQATCTYAYTQISSAGTPWAINASYVSSNQAQFSNSSASTTYAVGPDDTQITITPSLPSSAFTLNSTMTYTIQVSSIQRGTPTGTLNVSDSSGASCTNLPLTNGQATCSVTYSSYNTYILSASYVSNSNAFNNSGPTTYPYYAWPVPVTPAAACPQPGSIDFSTKGQINFNLSNPKKNSGGVVQSITKVDVYWNDSSAAKLQTISLGSSGIYSNAGLTPTVANIPITTANSLAVNSSQNLKLTFEHQLGTGTYVAQVTFSSGSCVLTVRGSK